MYDLSLLLFNNGSKFEDSLCNGCHDFTILSVNISDIAIFTIKNTDYRCITYNSKSEAIKFIKKLGSGRFLIYIKYIILILSLFKAFFYFFCFVNIKWLKVNIIHTAKSFQKWVLEQ